MSIYLQPECKERSTCSIYSAMLGFQDLSLVPSPLHLHMNPPHLYLFTVLPDPKALRNF